MVPRVEKSYVQVWTAEKTKHEQLVPTVSGLKRTLRHLWLVRATEPPGVFEEETINDFDTLRNYQMAQYPEFFDNLQERLKSPYKKPRRTRKYKLFPDEDKDNIILPDSAKPFTIVNKNGTTRQAVDFKQLLRRKIASDFPWQKLGTLKEYESVTFETGNKVAIFDLLDEVNADDVDIFNEALRAYVYVDPELLNFLTHIIERIKALPPLENAESSKDTVKRINKLLKKRDIDNQVGHDDPEVYYGRDTKWIFLARKAQQLDAEQEHKLFYLIASKSIIGSEAFRDYVLACKIPFDAYHIDGYVTEGPATRKVLSILLEQDGKDLTDEDFERRGRFVAAVKLPDREFFPTPDREMEFPERQQLFPEYDNVALAKLVMQILEDRIPGDPTHLFRIQQNGMPEPAFNSMSPHPYVEEIRNWAMEQAVVRHFLPKGD